MFNIQYHIIRIHKLIIFLICANVYPLSSVYLFPHIGL
jgi:hypothetical protein